MNEFVTEKEVPETYTNIDLVSEDRNGTKYFTAVEKCTKCNGSGEIPYYNYYCQGVCFSCHGSGIHNIKYKVYTAEHAEKLKKQRAKRAEAKKQKLIAESAEYNLKYIQRFGFNAEGKGYLTVGKTYEIREQLKELGGKFQYRGLWILPVDTDLCDTVEINAADMFHEYNYAGQFYDVDWKPVETAVENYKKEQNKGSNYVGSIGDKLQNLELTFVKRSSWFETKFGTMAFFTFEDSEHNSYSWCTSRCPGYWQEDVFHGMDEGQKYTLKSAAIKDHSEYEGLKQTVLTRCRFVFE